MSNYVKKLMRAYEMLLVCLMVAGPMLWLVDLLEYFEKEIELLPGWGTAVILLLMVIVSFFLFPLWALQFLSHPWLLKDEKEASDEGE